jgi:hypothetical protein
MSSFRHDLFGGIVSSVNRLYQVALSSTRTTFASFPVQETNNGLANSFVEHVEFYQNQCSMRDQPEMCGASIFGPLRAPSRANRRSASHVPVYNLSEPLSAPPARQIFRRSPSRPRAPEQFLFNNLRSRLFFEVKDSDVLLEI